MPLFKVCPIDRSKKVMVKASTLQELIDSAKTKLKISDEVYKLALDEDGTEVDDDDILLEIAKCSQMTTNLMLLPIDSTWQPPLEKNTATNTEPKKSIANNLEDNSRQLTPSVETEVLGANIWKKFPKRLMDACNNDLRAWDADRRAMVTDIATYMVQDLKDTSRATAERIAKIITDKYPKTFSDIINNVVVGSGMDSLRQQIYNAVNYRKHDKQKKIIAEMRLSDDEDEDDSSVPSTEKPRDEYGCVEFQPLLPEDESETSQAQKKTKLKEYFSSQEEDDTKISQLMNATYPTQRVDINKKKRDLTELFTEWPYLLNPKFLIDHGSRLLGKSVQPVWEQNLITNAEPLRKYVSLTEKSRMLKSKKSKESSEQEPSATKNEILEIISEAKASRAASDSHAALLALTFPLILNQMHENSKHLFLVIPENFEIIAISEYAKQNYPILIVRGKSLVDDKAKCDVVLEEKSVISARGLLDGFLIVFLSYYIFGYQYPPEISKTLEFIQRVLLQINPPRGDKRKDKKKRRTMGFEAANALEPFKED